jgi:hypothetical protein
LNKIVAGAEVGNVNTFQQVAGQNVSRARRPARSRGWPCRKR